MKLTFLGADHEVTGSCHYLNTNGKNILIDCGMEQGPDLYENQELSVNAAEIDYVLLTHAHIDHTGLVPLLYSQGFRGKIYATKATSDLCDIMLQDSAHIQMFEAEWRNRKAKRSGGQQVIPIYDMDDALGVLKLFVPCPYDSKVELCQGIVIRFTDVGHLLGSASIEIWAKENEIEKKIVFSGDIGNVNQPLIKDPQYIKSADYVVMESTYGNRSHEETTDSISKLSEIIQQTFNKGGNLVIPSFAVGRTQEILYFLRIIKEKRLVQGHENFEVYLDSPLAIEATNVFLENNDCCFDEEVMELVKQGINPIHFPGLKTTTTSQESKEINFDKNPKVIISASGMCEAGRIRHHLKHNLWGKENTILFVGYQAIGTLGRNILDGAKSVKLFGEVIEINARIEKLEGISGHADREGLLRWLQAYEIKPERVFVVHGEDQICEQFTELLKKEYHYSAVAPYSGEEYDLITNTCIAEGNRERKEVKKSSTKRASAVYARLIAAGQRLVAVIQHNEGGANKDLAKFADQIHALCDKWNR